MICIISASRGRLTGDDDFFDQVDGKLSLFSSYHDLELFVNLVGFTPMEAILSATALGGEIMLHPHELGKVQPGYYADLILVDGNPLEDISVLTATNGKLDVIMIVGG